MMIRLLFLIGLLAPAMAGAQTLQFGVTFGLPPVIEQEPMVVEVLAEPGSCLVHPLMPAEPCAQVLLPNGETRTGRIDGFAEAGPARLHVYQLTYDWSQNTASHPVVPDFALIERLD